MLEIVINIAAFALVVGGLTYLIAKDRDNDRFN